MYFVYTFVCGFLDECLVVNFIADFCGVCYVNLCCWLIWWLFWFRLHFVWVGIVCCYLLGGCCCLLLSVYLVVGWLLFTMLFSLLITCVCCCWFVYCVSLIVLSSFVLNFCGFVLVKAVVVLFAALRIWICLWLWCVLELDVV